MVYTHICQRCKGYSNDCLLDQQALYGSIDCSNGIIQLYLGRSLNFDPIRICHMSDIKWEQIKSTARIAHFNGLG